MKRSGDDTLVRQIREWADEDHDWDRENIVEGLRDLQFLAGNQWDEKEAAQRKTDGRPVLTVNRLLHPVKQVINDLRQARPGIVVAPMNGEADQGVAGIYAGLLRQIHRKSNASWVYAMAGGHAASCGIGNFRILHDYQSVDSFEQELRLELIPFPFSVLWDSQARQPDRSDARRCLIFKLMSKSAFEAEYPGHKADSFGSMSTVAPRFSWTRNDAIVVAEVFWKEPRKKRIVMTASGKVYDATDIASMPVNEPVIRDREVMVDVVKHVICSGAEPLSETTTWPGRYIPVVAIVGHEIPLENRVHRQGVIRPAIDSQRLHNYWRSSSAEWISQGLKAPILGTAGQIGPYRDQWETANTTPRPYLLYQPDPDLPPGAKPERIPPATPPAAMWEEGRLTGDEIKAQTGIYDASLGARSNEVSGKAIDARAQAGEMANFEIADNLALSINHAGRILVDLAPKIYDTERQLRILDEDEKDKFVPINVPAYGESGRQVLVNDLAAGTYDVAIKLGPSHASRRDAAAEGMIEFLKLLPDTAAVTADLVAEAQDWPKASKFAERIRKTIPPEVLGEDAPQQPPDPMKEVEAKLQVADMTAETRKKNAKALLDESKAAATRAKPILDARRQALDEEVAIAESGDPGPEPPS